MPSDESPSVGGMLRAARERQALSVEDIAGRTRIRSGLLREIESDNFAGCGDMFFARGHIRSIAATVGLDPAAVLAEFDATPGPSVARLETTTVAHYEPVKATMPPPTPTPHRPRLPTDDGAFGGRAARATRPTVTIPWTPWPQKSLRNLMPALAAAAAVIVLLAVASFLIGRVQGSPQQPDPAGAPSLLAVSPQPTPSGSASPQPPEGVNLQIRATSGSSWIRVTAAGGKGVYEGVMNTGDVKDFSDPEMLEVRFGNSKAVSVVVNGVDKGSPSCGDTVCSETYQLKAGAG